MPRRKAQTSTDTTPIPPPAAKPKTREVKPKEDYLVYVVAQAPVSIDTIKRAGGKVTFELRKKLGSARVERGHRLTVKKSVAEELLKLTHQSYEPGREDVFVATFRLEGKVDG